METISNEEKAIELAENISPYDIGGDNAAHYAAKDAALDAMEWKDEQHAKEKQKLIEKACNIIFVKVENYINFYGDNDYCFDKYGFIKQFKQAMKSE